MIFSPKLLVACMVGFGCYAPFHFVGGGEKILPASFPWKVESNPSFPLLVCRSKKSGASVVVTLESKAGSQGLKQGEKITLSGYEEKTKKPVNLFELAGGRNGVIFKLIIFEETGNHQLGEIGGDNSHKYGDDLKCENNIFEVPEKKWKEVSLDKLKLTPENCKNESRKQECDIQISTEVGLKWKDDLKPKVIF